jgi:anti-anti-sigma regulatory factor
LAQETALSLDLSEVDACDAASLQLFYAARASALRQQKEFRVAAVSSAVTDIGEALGMPLELLTKADSGEADDADRGNHGAQ